MKCMKIIRFKSACTHTVPTHRSHLFIRDLDAAAAMPELAIRAPPPCEHLVLMTRLLRRHNYHLSTYKHQTHGCICECTRMQSQKLGTCKI